MKKIIPYLSAFILSLLVLPGAVSAYEYGTFPTEANGDFIVGPTKAEIVVAPGETKTHRLTVKSRIDGEQKFELQVKDFVASDNLEEVIQFVDRDSGINPYFLSDYISTEITDFSLGLGESIAFDVTVSAPIDAEPGGRYGAIIIRALPEDTSIDGSGVRFYSEIAPLLLVRIEGELEEYGYIENFTVNDKTKGVFTKKPLRFSTFFKNEGNVHLIPYGQIVLSNMVGKEIASVPIDAHFSLPDSTRLRSFDWPGKEQKHFLIGRYKAELQMYPGYRDIPEIATLHFWYIPLRAVAIFLIVVFVLSFIHSYLKRNYHRVSKKEN